MPDSKKTKDQLREELANKITVEVQEYCDSTPELTVEDVEIILTSVAVALRGQIVSKSGESKT